MFKLLLRLWTQISNKRRTHVIYIAILMVLSSFFEIVSLGSLIPFLAVLANPSLLFENTKIAENIIGSHLLEYVNNFNLVYVVAMMYGFVVIMAALVKLALLKFSTRLAFAIGADLGLNAYRKTLQQDYLTHISRGSNEIIDGISIKVNQVINGVIMPALTISTNSLFLIAIVGLLIYVEPFIALSLFCGFGFIYFTVTKITAKRKITNSHEIANQSINVIRSLQEGVGGIRDIILDGSYDIYCKTFQKADNKLRKSQADNQFLGQAPRYGIEALGIIFVSLLACALSTSYDGLANSIPVLGLIALGTQKMLPVMQQMYGAFSSMQGSQGPLIGLLGFLEQPSLSPNPNQEVAVDFLGEIEIRDVSFSYGKNLPLILNGINLKLRKGSCVGIVGVTGSGKSTLVDVLMGLVPPTSGMLLVDGVEISKDNRAAWMRNIAHVPQNIFLADLTVAENIAFGIPRELINYSRVFHCARLVMLDDLINQWPEKYETTIGERGIRLSGGQKQRIGIARALYKEAKVIVLDEATSALDLDTENAVINSINQLDEAVTIIMVAHRLSTLKSCDSIITVLNGMSATFEDKVTFFKSKVC